MLVLIAPFNQSFDDKGLTYTVPENLREEATLGAFVEIPLWTKSTLWIIIDRDTETMYDSEKLKPLSKIVPWLTLNPLQIYLIRFIASQYFVAIHKSAGLFFSKFSQQKIEKGKFYLEQKTKEYTYTFTKKLSKKQNDVYEWIIKSPHTINLLWGITGSGKTEIYIQLLQKNLSLWKQWLFLIPEIILSSQIIERLKEVFWENVTLIHSLLTEKEKHEIWKSIYLWDTKIIVWTRSALFYPYKDLGYIIQDEEHDRSYKSENSPRYSIGDILIEISKRFWTKVLLGSGTPSIKTMYLSQWKKEIGYFWLLEEYKEEK